MGRYLVGGALLVCACHVRLEDLPQEVPVDASGADSPTVNPPPDGSTSLGLWGAPMKVGVAGTAAGEDDASLSSNTLEMVFAVADATNGGKDLYYTSRTSTTTAWQTPVKLAFNQTGPSEETPRFSADDLTLYFASSRTGGPGGLDIWKVTRPTIGGTWGTPTLVAGPNTAANEKWFAPCGTQGGYLVIVGNDIGEGTVGGAAPTIVTALSSTTASETGTLLTQDCLHAYFSTVPAGSTTRRIVTSTRTAVGAAWSTPTVVADFTALGGNQEDPWLANDNRTFVLVSDISGTKDVYISTR
jgi:hypothetical protein